MRLRLKIAYDGGPFQGWQSQSHGDTVQDRLEAAFAALCAGVRIPVHGSGRTDAGVHALGQVAHADVPGASQHSPARWVAALNAHLPPQIRVMAVRPAPSTFHARFSARGKVYRYRIWNAPVLPPLETGRAWHVPSKLDLGVMQTAAASFLGRHDFARFAANRGTAPEDTHRTIHRADIRRRAGGLVTLEVQGDGFLYKMVRLMTGQLVRCGQGRAAPDSIAQLLAEPQLAPKVSFAAPAEGLCLVRVLYGSQLPPRTNSRYKPA
jgi:tRNA pseudouridine38-40 synthase